MIAIIVLTEYWPLTIFQNIIDISTYNGFDIWSELSPSWMESKINWWRFFLDEPGKAHVTPSTPHSLHSSISSTGKGSAVI